MFVSFNEIIKGFKKRLRYQGALKFNVHKMPNSARAIIATYIKAYIFGKLTKWGLQWCVIYDLWLPLFAKFQQHRTRLHELLNGTIV